MKFAINQDVRGYFVPIMFTQGIAEIPNAIALCIPSLQFEDE